MNEEITLCVSSRSLSQFKFFTMVMAGLRKAGMKPRITTDFNPKTKLAACWAWRGGQMLRASGCDVLVFERGYLGDRFHWTSAAWNGLNGRGDFCLPDEVSGDRFNQHFSMKPWKKNGKNIIIMGQVMGDMSLAGRDLTKFYEETAAALQAKHGLPVFFRQHPAGVVKDRNFRPNIPLIYGDLQDVLDKAALVVSYNSNSGVDAVIDGVPSLSFDEGSMAWEVTGHTIDDIVTPDREQWAYKLAHCQWSPDEIESGVFWERMKCKLEN